jgi:hypothetical protein
MSFSDNRRLPHHRVDAPLISGDMTLTRSSPRYMPDDSNSGGIVELPFGERLHECPAGRDRSVSKILECDRQRLHERVVQIGVAAV